jgi:hypothetical protein
MAKRSLFLLLSFLVALTGCVSGPSTVRSEENKPDEPPQWVLKSPEDDSTYKYFVGTGTSKTGDTAEARSIAAGDIYSAIQRYIGVDVSAITIAENRASLDSFKTDITQTITQEGSARVAGFETFESWADHRRKPAVTIYLLARYSKIELAKEKKRQEELLKEEIEAIEGPEREGKALVSSGKYYEGAKEFLIAASNALNSKLANADIRFKRNIDQAARAVDAISLVKINDNISGLVGQELPEPLRIKAVAGASESDPGIPDVKLKVSYRELHRPSGNMRPKTSEITTDSSGYAEFEHPVPSFVGGSDVTVSLILNTELEGLDKAPSSQQELVENLEEMVVRKKAVYKLTFTSAAKSIKTGILMIDYDSEGNIVGINQSASALKSSLYDFNLTSLGVSPSELVGKNEFEIASLLTSRFKGQIERIIFGTVRIVDYRKSGNKVIAKASGTVQVLQTSTGNILMTGQREKSGLGNDNAGAASSAFKSMGQQLGTEIRNNLQ